MKQTPQDSMTGAPVVVAHDLKQVYKISRGFLQLSDHLQAVSGVSFTLHAGKTLAVVGESGCGKSTLARMVSLIETPTSGELSLGDVDVVKASPQQRHALRRTVQLVFQNPFGSLNPRKKIGTILESPLEINTNLDAQTRADQARAARLPSLSLTANLGVGAATLEALSSSAAAVAALALSLTAPLFDGGAGAARVALQEAALTQARASYRAAELAALQQVEDAMSALRADRERLGLLQELALSASSAATMARQRFGGGLVDFQIVLETQRSLLSIQTSLAQAWADVSADQVRLYSALGGGWNPNAATTARPTP